MSTVSDSAITKADIAGTIWFAITAGAAVIGEGARPVAIGTALLLFAAGCGAFLAAFLTAVSRSRTEAIGIGGLYFLAGDTAPDRTIARTLQALLAVQVVVALATASARPFTSLAFGILVPVYGLGLMGLYGARHGRFDPRSPL